MKQAAWLVGAANGMLERADLPRWSGRLTERHDARGAKLRDTLGARRFENARDAGETLPTDAASSEALAWDPDLRVETEAHSNESPVGRSPREREVVRLMADGLTNQEIADRL